MVFWISTVSWYVVWNNLYYIVIGLIIAFIKLVLIFAKIRSGKLLFLNTKDWVWYIIKLIFPRLVFISVMYILKDISFEYITILFVLSESFLHSFEYYIGSLIDKIISGHNNFKAMLRGLGDELGKRTDEKKMYMIGKEENMTNDKKNLKLNHIHFMQSDNDKGEGGSPQEIDSPESEFIEYIAINNPFIRNPLISELNEPDLFYHIKVDQNYGSNVVDMVNGYNDTVDESLIFIRTLYIDYQEALRNIETGNATVFLLREIHEDILDRINDIKQARDLVETWIPEFFRPQDSNNSSGSSEDSERSESNDSSTPKQSLFSVSKQKRSRDDFFGSETEIDSNDHTNKKPRLNNPKVSQTFGSSSHTETDTDIASIFESGLGMFQEEESSPQTNSESACESPSHLKRKRDHEDSDDSESERPNKKNCSPSSSGQTIYPDGTTKGKSRADR